MRHGSEFVVQASPAVHEAHAPPLQTRFVPHAVPFDSGAAALSTQADVPVAQEVIPVRHGSGFVAHESPAVQEAHAPPLQTMFAPQLVPFAFAAASRQTDVPVAQEVTPSWQSGSGFDVQDSPAVHDAHVPALHTRFVPQLVPFGFAVASTQTEVPVAQDVTPWAQAAFGFVPQGRPAVQEEHVPWKVTDPMSERDEVHAEDRGRRLADSASTRPRGCVAARSPPRPVRQGPGGSTPAGREARRQ